MDSIKVEDLEKRAIQAALENNWDQAVVFNQQILTLNPRDINALNRLATAYSRKGQIKKAQKTYRLVLKIDPYNTIAHKNLKNCISKNLAQNSYPPIDPNLFLEEPGKTKTLFLDQANADVLANLNVGDAILLHQNRGSLILLSKNNQIVGTFDKNFSQYLGKLMRMGNKYRAYIMSLENNKPKIFIREIKKDPQLKDITSFPIGSKRQYRSFLKEDFLSLISEQPGIQASTEEEFDEKNSEDNALLEDAHLDLGHEEVDDNLENPDLQAEL
ncbi:hypothetical protein COS81_02040 [candidate division WWE3 bacterium CG06_land_8_20_14_3_00_42_16]|uniref:Uncharacterized protein n=3 Tax=Katanobacteria TaxID=422282 RepID=A0A2M7ANK0_UNCKA|nr:MAG: hypothetical protein COS81_02040 [candidate division WWE3 bacterium CG06_land_8_20_14_3_00_42_16]PIZ43929.1 MAG: hypothetical protein COY34_00100 [candidate division WWE3 bacterium CG_4_10_14_0_2_um_filter_42_8]PJC68906.1 MAG: hypothetical protein CO015_02285 [candidate division WWE3 bacterium CG_4_8_14_3_um_filter_42_11]